MTLDGADSFSLNQIYFYLTGDCNLRCRHCWISPGFSSDGRSRTFLDFDLFRGIIAQAKPLGLSGVKLTGGEPLIHPRILDVIRHVRDAQLALSVETNGVSCTPELAATIAQCRNTNVSVSLDGSDAQTHDWMRGVPGSFDAAVEGIGTLVGAGVRPQIIMSLVKRNRDQIEKVVSLAESLAVASVKFNIVQPTARGLGMRKAGETLTIEELVGLGHWVEHQLAHRTSVRLIFSHPPAFRPLRRVLGPDASGCQGCGILGIIGVLADGSYALCGIGRTVPELVFGTAAKDALEEVWRESTVLNEIRAGLPDRLTGVCRQCLLMPRCLGECLAQNYSRTRDLWAPYWYCEEAFRHGLFPSTRIAAPKNEP